MAGIPDDARTDLSIYSLTGQRIRQFADLAARNAIVWNGDNDLGVPVPAGIYYIALRTGSLSRTRAVILID